MRTAALLLAVAASWGASAPAPVQGGQPASRRVLFIGNSLTYANDLPKLVERTSVGVLEPITTAVVAFPDFSLGDHWDKGDALAAIRRGGWDFVVLQQGPSSMPESRAQLIADTRRFDIEIRRAGARTALYQVWPPKARERFAPDVSRSYAEAAKAVGGLLLPVGDAWQAALKADPAMRLYGPDEFHPSIEGSALAARVIVETITGKPVPRR
jgi:hypothetical protein